MTTARRWAARLTVAAVIWVVVVGFAKLTERTPHLLGLGAAVLATLAVVWLCTDALAIDAAPEWSLYRSVLPDRTFDPRFSRLSQELAEAGDARRAAVALHESLSDVADRLLDDKYDVRRDLNPEAARELLGEEVASYLDRDPSSERNVFTPELLVVLDRLEAL